MSFRHSKSLPRRTVLRGLGATLALPFLDAMVPAFSLRASPPASRSHRFQTFYVPNGMAMEYWTPKGEGAGFELSPILEPLAPFRDQMLVLSGPQGELELHPRRRVGIVSHRHDARRPQRSRDHRRRLDGPDARAGSSPRRRRSASLELVDGCAGQRRRLHRQPELRLHAHDLVAQRRRSRCRWSTTRARCSRSCSATAAAPIARRAKRGCASTRASWIRSTRSWPA